MAGHDSRTILDEPLPDPTVEVQDGGEQPREGLVARHQRVSTLLTRLATTARSFLLYDPGNAATHRFLSLLLEEFASLLRDEGQIAIQIQPFELRFEEQTVYLNRDREKSLASRLYRDGVRMLTFYQGFDWEELARLLEILSIRYSGIHQREDDMVTLLWKGRFAHLDAEAVDGVADQVENEIDGEAGGTKLPFRSFTLSEELDLPRPELPTPKGPSWVDVPPQRLEFLLAEVAPEALPEECLSLLIRLRRELNDSEEKRRFHEVAHLFSEVRDFLLTDETLPTLSRLVGLLCEMASEDAPAWDPARPVALHELLEGCGDRRAIRRLLRSIPADQRQVNPELIEVLSRSCPDPLTAVTDALAEERSMGARAVARQLLERFGQQRWNVLQKRFIEANGQQASDLLRVIARIGGEEATSFVARQAAHADPAVQDEALWHLEHMPFTGVVGRALMEALRVSEAPRRLRVLEIIAQTGDRRFLDHLAAYVEERAAALSTDEAAKIGRILGSLGGVATIPRWQAWLKPLGNARKGFEGPLARQVAAALALAHIPGERAAETLGAAFDHANEVSQSWILGALAHRQRQPGARR